jgi:hypothetical protein
MDPNREIVCPERNSVMSLFHRLKSAVSVGVVGPV